MTMPVRCIQPHAPGFSAGFGRGVLARWAVRLRHLLRPPAARCGQVQPGKDAGGPDQVECLQPLVEKDHAQRGGEGRHQVDEQPRAGRTDRRHRPRISEISQRRGDRADIADDQEGRVWDSTSELRYLVLPQRPPGSENMNEEELAGLVTRNSMIGTDRELTVDAGENN